MFFSPVSTWLVALLTSGSQWLNEKMTKTIPAENWANKELQHQDMMNGVSQKEIVRRAELGRYYLPNTPSHPEPHRDPESGKIIIENNKLYYEDIDKYGAVQAQKWVKEGRYNLTPEEYEKEKERIRKKYERLMNG